MRKGVAILCGAALAACASLAHAGGPGTTAANFLKIGAGARPSGMGETFVGTADDVNAIYWNPSGLAQLPGWEVEFMHGAWMQGVSYDYVATGGPIGHAGSFGLSTTLLNAHDIQGYQPDASGNPQPSGLFSASSGAGTLAYAQRLDAIFGDSAPEMTIGAAVKFIMQSLGGVNHSAYSADAGALWHLTDALQVGGVVSDIGTSSIGYSTPLHATLGGAYVARSVLKRGDHFIGSLDAVYWTDNQPRISAGIEYGIPMHPLTAAIRLGYRAQSNGVLSGFTAGAGLGLVTRSQFQAGLDVAYVPYGELGNALRIGLDLKF